MLRYTSSELTIERLPMESMGVSLENNLDHLVRYRIEITVAISNVLIANFT